MRALPFGLALALVGCVPSFDAFTVIEPGEDGGAPMDAGPDTDAGDSMSDAGASDGGGDDAGAGDGGGDDAGAGDAGDVTGCTSVLGCVGSCAEVVGSPLLSEEFDSAPSTFMTLSGTFDVNGGDLVLIGGDTRTSIIQSTSSFSDIVSCADVALPALTGADTIHELGQNLRGPMHGLTCYVDAFRDRIVMFSLNPGGNALIAMQRPSWLGDAVELRMLTYLRGTTGHCEVHNLTTGDVAVLDGTYGGEMIPVNVTFDGMAGSDIRIHRVVAGAPSSAAAMILP